MTWQSAAGPTRASWTRLRLSRQLCSHVSVRRPEHSSDECACVGENAPSCRRYSTISSLAGPDDVASNMVDVASNVGVVETSLPDPTRAGEQPHEVHRGEIAQERGSRCSSQAWNSWGRSLPNKSPSRARYPDAWCGARYVLRHVTVHWANSPRRAMGYLPVWQSLFAFSRHVF